jgi:electron-transferring-flavoprotein dehydrogenase
MADEAPIGSRILPARHQLRLPTERFIRAEPLDDEHVPMDVVFVGAGPAGLAGAIELARLVREDKEAGGGIGDVEIGVLEKAGELGEHCLSGAVVDPRAFRELFPDLAIEDFPFRGPVQKESVYLLTEGRSIPIPTPPTMRNEGNHVASICEIVRWLGARAEEAGVNLFTGFPVDALLVDGDAVVGVRTTPSGLDRDGEAGPGAMPATDIAARVTVLSEGTRGALAIAYRQWQQIHAPNPQIYALGVKEVWETPRPLDRVIHTLGWPLPRDAFGGSFCYPLAPDQLAIGLVVGLDYRSAGFDPHVAFQRMKLHPLFRPYLEGGQMLEWGAKTIPEGGFHALPERWHGDGLLIAGDTAGLVEVASLKGIHYAMQSGMYAARAIFSALKAGDVGAASLAPYDAMIRDGYIHRDLYARRNMRLTFKDGFYLGGAKAALMSLTKGAFPGGKIDTPKDAEEPKVVAEPDPFVPDGALTFSKVDAVFKSGNQTRDDIPSHLMVGEDVPGEVADMYAAMCPAGVYERDGDRLVVNAPNCIDCKATDVLGPRWSPREGGAGPAYKQM